jgi:hypothetical protein
LQHNLQDSKKAGGIKEARSIRIRGRGRGIFESAYFKEAS